LVLVLVLVVCLVVRELGGEQGNGMVWWQRSGLFGGSLVESGRPLAYRTTT